MTETLEQAVRRIADGLQWRRALASVATGVANLDDGETGLELHVSEHGLDIVRAGEILGRLAWQEIRGLDVPPARRRRRGRPQPQAELLIRAHGGEASFGVRALSAAELRGHPTPLVARYGRRR